MNFGAGVPSGASTNGAKAEAPALLLVPTLAGAFSGTSTNGANPPFAKGAFDSAAAALPLALHAAGSAISGVSTNGAKPPFAGVFDGGAMLEGCLRLVLGSSAVSTKGAKPPLIGALEVDVLGIFRVDVAVLGAAGAAATFAPATVRAAGTALVGTLGTEEEDPVAILALLRVAVERAGVGSTTGVSRVLVAALPPGAGFLPLLVAVGRAGVGSTSGAIRVLGAAPAPAAALPLFFGAGATAGFVVSTNGLNPPVAAGGGSAEPLASLLLALLGAGTVGGGISPSPSL